MAHKDKASDKQNTNQTPNTKRKPLDFKRLPMVDWYHVTQLISTGFKAMMSAIFGAYADRREVQAAIKATTDETCDYCDKQEVWIDYVSDMGDGFDSTYTVAKLLSQKELVVDGITTKMGNILILGGDQVYPVATREEYENRFHGPYATANPRIKGGRERPHLYALPGNHDWYDGLASYLKLFCQQRTIGNWETQQERSYFAIKLPYGWWIWGIDIQLEADIDKPQLDYFKSIAKGKMEKGDKVILCTAEPSWVYSTNQESRSYRNLKFFEQRYITNFGMDLVVTIAGDLHHYARYTLTEESPNIPNETQSEPEFFNRGINEKPAVPEVPRRHKITAGGGGAFLHPTHNLATKIANLREGTFELASRFPNKKQSRNLTFKNLLFPFIKWRFTVFWGLFYLFFTWFLQSNSYKGSAKGYVEKIAEIEGFTDFWKATLEVILGSPMVAITIGVMMLGFSLFTDTTKHKSKGIRIVGAIHGACYIFAIFTLIWQMAWFNSSFLPDYSQYIPWLPSLLLMAGMLFFGGLTGSFIMGIYLLTTNLILKLHDNEAFSSLEETSYKNFLRIHLRPNELTIYPIGINQVVKWKRPILERYDWREKMAINMDNWIRKAKWEEQAEEVDLVAETQAHLIEKPIVLKGKG